MDHQITSRRALKALLMRTPIRRVFDQRDQLAFALNQSLDQYAAATALLAKARAERDEALARTGHLMGGALSRDGAARRKVLVSEIYGDDADPYASFRVTPLPYDAQTDWGGESASIVRLVREFRPDFVVEVGTWKGCSAMSMCKTLLEEELCPTVLCVDTWGGLPQWEERYAGTQTPPFLDFWNANREQLDRESSWPGFISAYDQFLSNVVHRAMTEYIVPFPMDGRLAFRWLRDRGIQSHLIYIDGAHEYEDATVDIQNYWQLVKSPGVLMGDDFHPMWPGIMKAVHEFAASLGIKFTVDGNTWSIRKFG